MRNSFKSRALAVFTSAILIAGIVVGTSNQASAAGCTPIKATGKSAGTISIGSLSMPIKAFNYPAGGIMEPAKNTTAAGLSERHMPLSSKVGTSVVVWHRDYQGCTHPLDVFMSKTRGTRFSLTDENGITLTYKLTTVGVITKGLYKPEWFDLIGPRQIVMFTCTGVFKSGHYEKNMVFIATPV